MNLSLHLKQCAGKLSLLYLFVFLSMSIAFAQPPNDNCEGAIQLNVDAAFVAGDVEGATGGPGAPCTGDVGAVVGTPNDEVWYKFTATKPYLVIQANGSAQFDAVIQVFSGSCGNLAIMDCANEGKIGKPEKLPVNHYTPGETYYFRVYDVGAGKPATTGFEVKVYTPKTPGNDECANAKPVTVKDHCQYTTENQEGATGSPEPNTCANGAAKNDDIWYSFVPDTKRVVITVHASHNYRAVLEVFDKCGGTAIGCTTTTKHNQFLKLAFNDLKPGQTYYFRVFNYYTPLSKSQTFELCVYNPSLPENDECGGAIALNSSDTLTGDLNGSTASKGFSAPCSGTPDDDVWYKFNAVSTKEILELFPTPYFDGVLQVFDACSGGNLVGCMNAGGRNKKETLELTDLTPGKDYFVRVFSAEDLASVTSGFHIARTSGPKPPIANDECTNAIAVPISAQGVQSITGKLDNSSQSMAPCNDSDEANDVWFKFTANGSDAKVLVTPKSADLNMVFSVLDACNGQTLACVDDAGDGDAEEWVSEELIKGQVYFIRVYDGNGNNHSGSFTLSLDGVQVIQSISSPLNSSFKIFPIPVVDYLRINSEEIHTGEFVLTDIQGNIMHSESGSIKDAYDISAYPSGLYILKIVSEDKVFTIKIMKK